MDENIPPQGGLAKRTLYGPSSFNWFFRMWKQSPSNHVIFFSTPYILALCLAQARTAGSFSMAYTRFHRLDFAKAMVLPPAPANASTKIFRPAGAEAAMCSAILLRRQMLAKSKTLQQNRTNFATGSGVTPNQASSVSQMPSSYLENILCRCTQ